MSAQTRATYSWQELKLLTDPRPAHYMQADVRRIDWTLHTPTQTRSLLMLPPR